MNAEVLTILVLENFVFELMQHPGQKDVEFNDSWSEPECMYFLVKYQSLELDHINN